MLEVNNVFEANNIHLLEDVNFYTTFHSTRKALVGTQTSVAFDTNSRGVFIRSDTICANSNLAALRGTLVNLVLLKLGSTMLHMFKDRRRHVK